MICPKCQNEILPIELDGTQFCPEIECGRLIWNPDEIEEFLWKDMIRRRIIRARNRRTRLKRGLVIRGGMIS